MGWAHTVDKVYKRYSAHLCSPLDRVGLSLFGPIDMITARFLHEILQEPLHGLRDAYQPVEIRVTAYTVYNAAKPPFSHRIVPDWEKRAMMCEVDPSKFK